MNKRRLAARVALAFVLALSFAALAFGQASERVVKARAVASVDALRPGDKFKVAVVLEIAEGFHVNASVPTLDYLIPTSVKFEAPTGVRLDEEKYPHSKSYTFEFEKETPLDVYDGTVIITADAEADSAIKQGEANIRAIVEVQACNDKQCLAPSTLTVDAPIKVVAASQPVRQANADLFARAESLGYAAAPAALSEFKGGAQNNTISDLISRQGIVVALLSVFLAGLLLNTTPCVYPIIPITIGFFMNQGDAQGKPRLRRTFLMALMYVLGMAITYSILGVIASMTKGLFGAALQNPFVLVLLAGLMVALSLSMFGLYEFRLPGFLNRFADKSAQSTGGLAGALVMGLTMGIVAAPCIGPFVLGLLVHVGTKGDPVYGFFIFFVLALGLGLPYLILGTFSGALKSLPRSGEWMVTVRKVFGLILIGMALYFLMPLMGRFTSYVFVAFFAISALYLILWEAGRTKPKQFGWALRAIGVGAAVIAVMMALPNRAESGIVWQPYSEQALMAAKSEGRGVIIDAYADWCIPCKELDQLTFTDPAVKKEAERFVTLKLDLTSNDPGSEAGRARARFEILGVPTILFLDPDGRERTELRLEGFEEPDSFLSRMERIESAPAAPESDRMLASNAKGGAGVATDAGLNGSLEIAPDLRLNLLDGSTLSLESLRGKVVLVDFWATWCVPCISEIPMFNQFHADYESQGFEMIAISLDEEGAVKVRPFLKRYPMRYTQVVGDQQVADAFKVGDSSLPVAFLIDKQGRIRSKHVGVTPKEVFESEIKQLLGE
jgi:thiol:disulfide interchange protein DsbD